MLHVTSMVEKGREALCNQTGRVGAGPQTLTMTPSFCECPLPFEKQQRAPGIWRRSHPCPRCAHLYSEDELWIFPVTPPRSWGQVYADNWEFLWISCVLGLSQWHSLLSFTSSLFFLYWNFLKYKKCLLSGMSWKLCLVPFALVRSRPTPAAACLQFSYCKA